MIGTGTIVSTTSVIGTITGIVGMATITIGTIDRRALGGSGRSKQRRVCNALTQARNGYSGLAEAARHSAQLEPR